MDRAGKIWNRACGIENGETLDGDRVLAAMLLAHGLIMNGGVLHATECMSPEELSNAVNAYTYFGKEKIGHLLLTARECIDRGNEVELERREREFDEAYGAVIPHDGLLVMAFEQDLERSPERYGKT